MYVRNVKSGTTNSSMEPEIVKESPATALVDGNNLLGPVVGNFCMKLAIKKAKEVGIGMVVANRSNHYGIAGYYSMQALEEKLIVRLLQLFKFPLSSENFFFLILNLLLKNYLDSFPNLRLIH